MSVMPFLLEVCSLTTFWMERSNPSMLLFASWMKMPQTKTWDLFWRWSMNSCKAHPGEGKHWPCISDSSVRRALIWEQEKAGPIENAPQFISNYTWVFNDTGTFICTTYALKKIIAWTILTRLPGYFLTQSVRSFSTSLSTVLLLAVSVQSL